MTKDTCTDDPISVDTLTYTHARAHADNADSEMELCWKHTGFPRSRGSLPSLRKREKKTQENEEKALVANR
jgi:hypothetical protein